MAARTKITSSHWDSIVGRIDNGLCVPFLGAGVNAGSGMPVGAEVSRRLLAKLLGESDVAFSVAVTPTEPLESYPDLSRARVEDLARVALHLELEVDHGQMVDYLREIIDDANCEPPAILRTLARLPIKLIVTTNYDGLLERAFELEGVDPPPFVLSQPIGGFGTEALQVQESLLEKRVIYKLHGSFGDPEPNVLVSEDHYIEFLGIANDGVKGMPPQISSKIKNGILLFLGHGLEDWDVRMIYKLQIETLPERERKRSFAIQKDPNPFWVSLWKSKNVEIYNLDLAEFAGQLEVEYASRSKG